MRKSSNCAINIVAWYPNNEVKATSNGICTKLSTFNNIPCCKYEPRDRIGTKDDGEDPKNLANPSLGNDMLSLLVNNLPIGGEALIMYSV